MTQLFGRTNLQIRRTWLRMVWPKSGLEEAIKMGKRAEGCVLDVTSASLLWGKALQGTNVTTLVRGGLGVENAVDQKQAEDLLAADIVQAVSALSRGPIDFYAFRLRRALEAFQIEGVVQTLIEAQESGLIRHFGLSAEGPESAVLYNYQFRDAFDFVIAAHDQASLRNLTNQRRAAFVSETLPTSQGFVMLDVQSLADIEALLQKAEQ